MREDKDKIIDNLLTNNKIKDLQIELLVNLCERLEDYISDNNIGHKRVMITDLEGNQLRDINDFKTIVCVNIPEMKFLIKGSDENE